MTPDEHYQAAQGLLRKVAADLGHMSRSDSLRAAEVHMRGAVYRLMRLEVLTDEHLEYERMQPLLERWIDAANSNPFDGDMVRAAAELQKILDGDRTEGVPG